MPTIQPLVIRDLFSATNTERTNLIITLVLCAGLKKQMATNSPDQKMFLGIVFPAGWGKRFLNDRGKREEWPCVSFSLERRSFKMKKTLAISAGLLETQQLNEVHLSSQPLE